MFCRVIWILGTKKQSTFFQTFISISFRKKFHFLLSTLKITLSKNLGKKKRKSEPFYAYTQGQSVLLGKMWNNQNGDGVICNSYVTYWFPSLTIFYNGTCLHALRFVAGCLQRQDPFWVSLHTETFLDEFSLHNKNDEFLILIHRNVFMFPLQKHHSDYFAVSEKSSKTPLIIASRVTMGTRKKHPTVPPLKMSFWPRIVTK